MKIPIPPPQVDDVLSKLMASNQKRAMKIIWHQEPTDYKGRYIHWDKLIHLEPPHGYTPEEWWIGIKFARQKLYKPLIINDRKGNPFKTSMPDCVLKDLHWLDRHTVGNLFANMPVTNPHMKNTYLIRSFVEEAINSSQMEGASTTRNVAKEMLRKGRAPLNRDEQMIFNNFHAMQFIKEIRDEALSPQILFELHRIITEKTLDNPSDAGKFRTENDDIKVVDRTGGGILHTPPEAKDLPDRMRKICDFANSEEPVAFIHPIIRAILLHFILAYDHPFVDGNGRTARALFYWSVSKSGYWVMEFLSISRIIKMAQVQYGKAFLYTETDDNDTTYFVIHQLEVINKAIKQLQIFLDKKVKDIEYSETLLRGSQRLKGRLNLRQLGLLRHALKHPSFVYTIKEHQNTHGIVYETSRNDLLKMSDSLDLLIKQKAGRSFIFISPEDLQDRIQKARM